jgi:hypothetical protein
MTRLIRAVVLAVIATVLAVVVGILLAVLPTWLTMRWLGERESWRTIDITDIVDAWRPRQPVDLRVYRVGKKPYRPSILRRDD